MKSKFIIIFTFWGACLPLLTGQEGARAQDVPVLQNAPPDLSGLQLSPGRQTDLEDALKSRDWKKAETILVEEADGDPKSGRASKLLVLAGGAFFLDGQYLNAVVAWKKAEAIAPLDERTRFTLAMAYVKLNRRDWARPELEELAEASPDAPLYAYWLSRLDYDGRKFASAISRLQKVIELDPKMMRAYDLLGLCYDHQGHPEQALKNYRKAIELNRMQAKPSPWPHVDLAIALLAANQLVEAEQNLREAIGYDPRLPQAHYQLGRVLELQGNHQAAMESLNQAVKLDPAYPEPHYLLGRVYHRLGNDFLSKVELNRFQELKKASEEQGASKLSPVPPTE